MHSAQATAPRRGFVELLNDESFRAVIFQIVAIVLVVGIGWYLVHNTLTNLAVRNISTGFGYLDQVSAFAIGESLIPYQTTDTYFRAIVVGLLNTLQVAVIGIVLATILGTIIGVARLSSNWLIAKLTSVYIETLRNVPLLLQLFFWYAIITQILPHPREALAPIPGVVLSNRGMQIAVPDWGGLSNWVLLAIVLGALVSWFIKRWADARQEATGKRPDTLWKSLGLIVGLPLIVWLAGGAPTAMDSPSLQGFAYRGGTALSPEFVALLTGLTLYTAAFIAEIVRSGILAVNSGQWEAGLSLGLSRSRVLRLIVLPQALRIIVPPTTSQYLNLTKNSSLAVAIGYPDLVSVVNTTLNQTGQAIENIAILMAVYLTISLSISAFMNWYNAHIALVER